MLQRIIMRYNRIDWSTPFVDQYNSVQNFPRLADEGDSEFADQVGRVLKEGRKGRQTMSRTRRWRARGRIFLVDEAFGMMVLEDHCTCMSPRVCPVTYATGSTLG